MCKVLRRLFPSSKDEEVTYNKNGDYEWKPILKGLDLIMSVHWIWAILKKTLNFHREDTLILAVATAADEIENSIAIKKAKEVDKSLRRTVGVLTKMTSQARLNPWSRSWKTEPCLWSKATLAWSTTPRSRWPFLCITNEEVAWSKNRANYYALLGWFHC